QSPAAAPCPWRIWRHRHGQDDRVTDDVLNALWEAEDVPLDLAAAISKLADLRDDLRLLALDVPAAAQAAVEVDALKRRLASVSQRVGNAIGEPEEAPPLELRRPGKRA